MAIADERIDFRKAKNFKQALADLKVLLAVAGRLARAE
jgi:hypothetical protein